MRYVFKIKENFEEENFEEEIESIFQKGSLKSIMVTQYLDESTPRGKAWKEIVKKYHLINDFYLYNSIILELYYNTTSIILGPTDNKISDTIIEFKKMIEDLESAIEKLEHGGYE